MPIDYSKWNELAANISSDEDETIRIVPIATDPNTSVPKDDTTKADITEESPKEGSQPQPSGGSSDKENAGVLPVVPLKAGPIKLEERKEKRPKVLSGVEEFKEKMMDAASCVSGELKKMKPLSESSSPSNSALAKISNVPATSPIGTVDPMGFWLNPRAASFTPSRSSVKRPRFLLTPERRETDSRFRGCAGLSVHGLSNGVLTFTDALARRVPTSSSNPREQYKTLKNPNADPQVPQLNLTLPSTDPSNPNENPSDSETLESLKDTLKTLTLIEEGDETENEHIANPPEEGEGQEGYDLEDISVWKKNHSLNLCERLIMKMKWMKEEHETRTGRMTKEHDRLLLENEKLKLDDKHLKEKCFRLEERLAAATSYRERNNRDESRLSRIERCQLTMQQKQDAQTNLLTYIVQMMQKQNECEISKPQSPRSPAARGNLVKPSSPAPASTTYTISDKYRTTFYPAADPRKNQAPVNRGSPGCGRGSDQNQVMKKPVSSRPRNRKVIGRTILDGYYNHNWKPRTPPKSPNSKTVTYVTPAPGYSQLIDRMEQNVRKKKERDAERLGKKPVPNSPMQSDPKIERVKTSAVFKKKGGVILQKGSGSSAKKDVKGNKFSHEKKGKTAIKYNQKPKKGSWTPGGGGGGGWGTCNSWERTDGDDGWGGDNNGWGNDNSNSGWPHEINEFFGNNKKKSDANKRSIAGDNDPSATNQNYQDDWSYSWSSSSHSENVSSLPSNPSQNSPNDNEEVFSPRTQMRRKIIRSAFSTGDTPKEGEKPMREVGAWEQDYEWLSRNRCENSICNCPCHKNMICHDLECFCANHEPDPMGDDSWGTNTGWGGSIMDNSGWGDNKKESNGWGVDKKDKRENKGVCFTWKRGKMCHRGENCKYAHSNSSEKSRNDGGWGRRCNGLGW